MNAPERIPSPLAAAWVKAFASIEGAVKSSNNPHYKSKFADLPSVIAAIKPHLVANDLAYFQVSHPHEKGVDIETVLVHSSGEERSIGRFFVPAAKNDPQGFGSASTYCRRFCLQTSFGLPAFDDDGNLGSGIGAKEKEPAINPILAKLRGAAMEGSDALKKEFESLKGEPGFKAIWTEQKNSLLATANSIDGENQ